LHGGLSAENVTRGAGLAAAPLSANDFSGMMARLGPFERNPTVAVAVSGGPDSLALTLLLVEWASARDATVAAITIDHGLRAESAAEAEQVGRWLAGRTNLRHSIIRWQGPKPESAVQSTARDARYALLTDHCRAAGILHLCLAHQLDDQIETHRMRAARGSSDYGLAGMSALRPWRGIRLLRPLLGVPKAVLRATLAARGQPWLEDPSNSNPAFERARLRAERAAGPEDETRQKAQLHRLGLERHRRDVEAATILAESLTLDPAGWATIDLAPLDPEAPAARSALARLLQCIGGSGYPVAEARLSEAMAALRQDAADFTLGGCHLRREGGRLEVFRDWGAIRDRIPVKPGERPGERFDWDRRYEIAVEPELPGGRDLTIARLGEAGMRQLGRAGHSQALQGVPVPARKALPALWAGEAVEAVPGLGFGVGLEARFRPAIPATSSGFTVAY